MSLFAEHAAGENRVFFSEQLHIWARHLYNLSMARLGFFFISVFEMIAGFTTVSKWFMHF